jgi:threonine/homoserine/homoserine lactone efflux protein
MLTLANPATILSFIAIFAGVGDVAARHPAALVSGVFIGSATWWLFLATVTGVMRRRVTPAIRRAIDVVSALCLGGFGLAALVSALH